MINSYYLPTKFIFGPDSVSRLGSEAKKLGRKAMLISASDILSQEGLRDTIITDLEANGVQTIIFDKVIANPRSSTVDHGAEIARSEEVDLIIGLGGGSAMDTAKGIAVASTGTESIWSYIKNSTKVSSSVPPIIQVPTIAGSGSEANNAAVITNWETREKLGLFSTHCFAKVAIIDPKLTLTVPRKPTVQGGVDIFCHLVETYITTDRPSPLTDGILETTMKIVVRYLPRVLIKLDDIEARTQLSWASTIATSQFSTLGGGAGIMTLHGIEHELSALYDITHGDGMAALLLAWMRFTFPSAEHRFTSLASNVFGEKDGIEATEKWLREVGMELKLRDIGVQSDHFDQLASNALKSAPFLKYHPRLLDKASIIQILRDSY